MWSLFVACTFACCGPSADATTPTPPQDLISEISQNLQTGSLIFSQGDCLAVKVFSRSSYTHVGGVVAKDGQFIVYDSMNGAGVGKTSLEEYVRRQTPSTLHIVHPTAPFSSSKAAAFEQHLESQLGRKYSVKHHLTGKRCDGLHCAEYMTDALMNAEVLFAKQPPRVSPGSLFEGVTATKAYQEGSHFELKVSDPPPALDRPWYERAWNCTSTTCRKSASQMRRWFVCR
ncbi:YiiX/YebB-like N1pC/P60 family cysteine hydrolase [Schlesneria sp. DSM 10557]|uniref:YiiX/YebB-like N1pC/P60 family cysteine hydrolase n=1 Tax=Schlesneria sp. DSM 10557 TaxID=3044399 RepID=UPI0035A068E1